MKRDAAIVLILGCFVILLLEAPIVMAQMLEDLDGPYPAWSEEAVRLAPVAQGDEGTAPLDEAVESTRRAKTSLAVYRP